MKKKSTHLRKLFAGTVLIMISLFQAPQAKAQLSFTEEFDTISNLFLQGWDTINHSVPRGTVSWFQGNPTVFNAYSGTFLNSYIGVNYNSTNPVGTISNWLFGPTIMMNNGDIIRFYTRKTDSATTNYPDRLQLRLSSNGSSLNIGTTATDVGDYSTLLLDINPTLSNIGYPTGFPYDWTQLSVTLSGLSGPTSGRLAFRYFVTNGGLNGTNSDYIGIDSVHYISVITGIQHPPAAIKASLFPNPGQGFFNLRFDSDKTLNGILEVVNELGEVVYQENLSVAVGENLHKMNLGNLSSGVYSVRLKSTVELFRERLVIQN